VYIILFMKVINMKLLFSIILSIFGISLFSQDIEHTYSRDIYNQVDNSKARTFDLSGGKVYYEADIGVDTMKFTSIQPATPDQVSITFQTLAATDTVYLDWGDGSAIVKISNVTDQIVTSSYTANNTTYNIKLYGDLSKVKKFYAFNPTVASLNINDISDYMVNLEYLHLRNVTATGDKALPTKITYLFLSGANINWTYEGALPTGINTYLYLNGANINWTYEGALPTGVTYLSLIGDNINWTYEGALPTGINTYLYLNGANINWTYEGALPTGVTYLFLSGANINWTYEGALPTGITYLNLNGANINWIGLDIGDNGNITNVSLLNYRTEKMSSADMVTLLTQMTNRTGSLPTTITINDYADYDSQPQDVKNAVEALKTAKLITTVTLGQ
jgi:hypothetical protein